MTSGVYSSLRRAQLTYDYLHTNSTTHEFLFGALAELVDNARDASSQKIDIYTEPCESCRGKFLLCFRDDGDGMEPSEVANVVQFGRSVKRTVDSRMIGQYGNGLKSGTMRIGKDMILFTKKGNTMSCLFLSRTFHEREKIEEVVVPMPSWEASTNKPLAKSKREVDKHQIETNLILKYSPFKTESQLFEQFNKIGPKGTLVVVYNLKLMDNGEPELDVISDPYDIKMGDPRAGESVADYDKDLPEHNSFRAYTAILYLDPRMKIYIQNKKVRTKRLTGCLYKPKCYHFTSKRFKTRSEQESEKADREAKIAEEKARELETQARELQKQAEQTSKDKRVELRKVQALASEARAEAQMKTKIADAKKKSMKEPKTLNFTFGFNIENRQCYGVFIYNCSRLIRMYEKVGPQKDGGVKCYGIIGVVDVPYLVLEPTHNKQDFADGKEFRHLHRALGEHLEQYWKDSQIESQGVTRFWETFGYIGSKWTDGPSMDQKFARKRAMQISVKVQCDVCLKWRELPFAQKNIGRELPDDWCCAMHPDPKCNSCERPEQKVTIAVGTLQKQVKTSEERHMEMQEDIRKRQEALKKSMERQRQRTPQGAQREDRVRIQPQAAAHKKIERTSSAESSNSSKSDSAERRLPKRPEADSTEGESRRTKPSHEPVKRRNEESRPAVEAVQAKRKKSDVQPAKTVERKESQEQREKTTKSREKPRPEESRPAEPRQEKPSREEPTPEVQRQEEQSKKDRTEQEQLELEQLMEWSSEGENDTATLPKGTKVEARVDNSKWYIGTVLAVKPKKGATCRVRVKFDMYPKDKYDKWFDHPSDDLRVLQPVEETAPKSPSPSREVPTSTFVETPPNQQQQQEEQPQKKQRQQQPPTEAVQSPEDNRVSSMSDETSMVEQEPPAVQEFADMLRRCLCYFAPPSFRIKKDEIKEMSTAELREFPLESFFDYYEKGLTELVNGFRDEKEEALQKVAEVEGRLKETENEKEKSTTKLLNLRKNAGKLLRVIQEDPNECLLSEDDVSDTVDEMMETIAHQAAERL
ncbi:MORC family CW-type zinc finger protein 2A-like [Orbicella faveolata]|uniref:MORC family CW-type zinc finger protein 2A-like n=1 Tax=Orbicella faveolata TaxID=48498 RepID=UPI0009E4767D|nr:MORC family CW-type zinc finger protein 2A-like [Orbicella faveolata]